MRRDVAQQSTEAPAGAAQPAEPDPAEPAAAEPAAAEPAPAKPAAAEPAPPEPAAAEVLAAEVSAEGAEEFLVAFETLAQAVRRARGMAPAEGAERLTLSQYSLLLPLAGGESARVSDLAADVGIAASTASRILDALDRRGIVRRTRSRRDRRGVVVSLTEQGGEALASQDEWMRGRQLAFLQQLAPAERQLVPGLLVGLADLIDDLSAGPDS